MELEGKRILVTGADGFIGSHLAEELARQGHRVRALVCYNALGLRGWLDRTDPWLRDRMEVLPGDVRDPGTVRAAVSGCDVVLHLAALIGIPWSYQAPASYVQTNVMGTLNVLEAARDHGVERVVHTSTSEVYGTARCIPITEDHPLAAQSPYAASKIAADQLALSYHRAFGTPVTILRPFNTYGPRQSARAVVPTIITQIAAGRRTLRLGATRPTRDLTHVSDTVSAFCAAARADAAVGEVVHTGTGYEIPIGDLAHLIAGLMDARVTLETDPVRLRPERSEVDRLCCDPSRAARVLGWQPAHAGRDGLARGLEDTIAWFLQEAGHTAAGAYCV